MALGTVDDVESPSSRAPQRLRTVASLALLGVLVAAALGAFGPRVAERTTTADGWTTSVRYAPVSRAGLDLPFTVTVRRPGGFTDDVTIAITSGYLRILDQQSMGPEPAEQTRDATWTYLTFTAPEGDTLRVDVEAYVRALRHAGASGRVAVLDDGRLVAPVDVRTRIAP